MKTTVALTLMLCLLFYAAVLASPPQPGKCSAAEYEARPAVPAFPEAEGFGVNTLGGRGGQVIIVTTLDDDITGKQKSLPGSLRAALLAKGPRIVVFDVSGTIALKAPLKISEPFITVAGQTAPGDG